MRELGNPVATIPTKAKSGPSAPTNIAHERRAAPSEKDLWVTIGKMQSDHDHLEDRVTLAEGNIGVLTTQGKTTVERLDRIDTRLDEQATLLQVLPSIKTAFDKQEAEQVAAEIRAERRQKAITTVMAKNSNNVGMLVGLIGASILQRVGTIPLTALYVVVASGILYFIVNSILMYSRAGKP